MGKPNRVHVCTYFTWMQILVIYPSRHARYHVIQGTINGRSAWLKYAP